MFKIEISHNNKLFNEQEKQKIIRVLRHNDLHKFK